MFLNPMLYCIVKKNVICNSSIKICLNQSVLTVTYFYFHFISAFYTFLGNEIVTGNALYRTSHWPCISSETYIFRATTNDYLSVITRVISLILSIVSFVVFMLLFSCYPLNLLALTFFIYWFTRIVLDILRFSYIIYYLILALFKNIYV